MENVVPCILAYVPETPQFKKKEQQKTVQLYGKNFLKAFGQPYSLYQELYYPAMGYLIQENTLGKIAFLPKNKIITAYNPQQFAREYVTNIQPEGNILLECCDYLGITLDNIGVGGSSLLFGKPVKRHEIDIAIYGKQACYRAFERIEQGYKKGIFIKSPYRYFPFCFKGIWFDPHFSEGFDEENCFHKVCIEEINKISNVTIQIDNATRSIFYPAIYEVNSDQKLISLRAGHVGLFKVGQIVKFSSLSLLKLRWSNGQQEIVYAILEDEWGEIEHS